MVSTDLNHWSWLALVPSDLGAYTLWGSRAGCARCCLMTDGHRRAIGRLSSRDDGDVCSAIGDLPGLGWRASEINVSARWRASPSTTWYVLPSLTYRRV